MKDTTEYEAKFYPIDKGEYRERLLKLDAKLIIPERKLTRVTADRRANKFLQENETIRVRDEGNLVRLSFKTFAGENDSLVDQKEVDVIVSDLDKTISILEKTGVVFNLKQESLREEWEYDGAQVTIDTWSGLDSLSEIEADSEEKVKEIAEKLGFDWNKKIITSAAEIFQRVYKLDIYEVLEKIAFITIDKNPFEGLEKYELEYN